MKNRLAPSILSGDFTKLGEQIRAIEAAGVTDLHFDVMDGAFVPNISFGIPVLKSLRPFSDLWMDAHLMILDPIRYVEAVDMILVMGVHPGFGGQGIVDGTFEKIKLIRDYMNEHHLERDLQVDGGIKLDNVGQAIDAGANVIVAGSAVFKDDVQANAEAFLRRMG